MSMTSLHSARITKVAKATNEVKISNSDERWAVFIILQWSYSPFLMFLYYKTLKHRWMLHNVTEQHDIKVAQNYSYVASTT